MLTVDGIHGEGGGQILRSSLALSLVTGPPSLHTETNAWVVGRFLEAEIGMVEEGDGVWRVTVAPAERSLQAPRPS